MKIDMIGIAFLGVAIIFTALSFMFAIYIIEKKWKIVGSLLLGVVGVVLGNFAYHIHLPFWLIMGTPIPFGLTILWFIVGKKIKTALITYGVAGIFYLVFHILLSLIFHYDSLIPGWYLHS
jgi:hypothetical protein